MKSILVRLTTVSTVLMVGLLGLSACNKGPGKANLKDNKAKYSYAIGHQIASNIKNQNIDLDKSAMMSAMNNVLSEKEPQMTEEEMREALRTMSQEQREKRQAEAEENEKKGSEFLESNKEKEGVKVTDSGLQYRVIEEGEGKKPGASDRVKVHYKGTLIDGTEFDSSYKRDEPAEFAVGGVIKGWQEGIQLMKEGAKYEFVIPAELAYGSIPRPQIPANSVLVFEVELLEVL